MHKQIKQTKIVISFLLFLCLISITKANTNFDLIILRAQSEIFAKAYDSINIQNAWQKIASSNPPLTTVKIGIIDTGVDAAHPEFAGQVAGSNIVGRVDLGSTPANARNDPFPGGHGTQVAGIIGANNLLGLGVTLPPDSPQINGILSGITDLGYTIEMRQFGSGILTGRLPMFDFLTKVRSIHRSGGRIINFSLAWVKSDALTNEQRGNVEGEVGTITFAKNTLALDLVIRAYADTLFVVSAGNENIDSINETPANIERDNIITVAATDLEDGRALFVNPFASNFGGTTDIVAPGKNVYAPKPGGDYNKPREVSSIVTGGFQGTSASAPMVTGVAGLIKALKPELPPAGIKRVLIESADVLTTDDADELGKKLGPVSMSDPIHCNPGNLSNARGCRLNAERAICHELVLGNTPACQTSPPPSCVLSGILSATTTVTAAESPCIIDGALEIPSDISLIIEPGGILKFSTSTAQIVVRGILDARGTASQPIFFTSIKDDSVGGDTNEDGSATTPSVANWDGITLEAGSNAVFAHATIRYGDTVRVNQASLSSADSLFSRNFSGIHLNGGIATITSSRVERNISHGINASLGTLAVTGTDFQFNDRALSLSPQVEFIHASNTASNNIYNGIAMSGTLGFADRTWTKDNIPYIVFSTPATSTVFVQDGSLTIDPGVVVKFAFTTSELRIELGGSLFVNGTATDPVFFTSIKDDTVGGDTNNDGSATAPTPGDWTTIRLMNNTTAVFTNSVIRYGTVGAFVFHGSAIFDNGHLENNITGVRLFSSGFTSIVGSEINNNTIGIHQDTPDTPGIFVTIASSSIHDNVLFGALATSSPPSVFNARSNWWGDPSGPFHPILNPTGAGNAVSDNVLFTPFLTTDPVGNLP